jgi:transcription factor MYB, plant
MKKDDPKVAILLQQADLLCSLATKINHEDTSQSMDEAWQVFVCGVWGVYTDLLL